MFKVLWWNEDFEAFDDLPEDASHETREAAEKQAKSWSSDRPVAIIESERFVAFAYAGLVFWKE